MRTPTAQRRPDRIVNRSLAHVPELKVKSRNSVFRYKGKDIDVQKVGKELTVDALLTGRVVQHGDAIQVSADLTSVEDNTEIWGEQYERKTSDIIALQQQIAGDIADKLRSKLSGDEKQQVTKQGTQNADAYQLYVKGRYYWNKRTNADIQSAISYFNQAIDKDPSYALAYAGLANAYSVLSAYGDDPNEVIPKSIVEAQKALELDPTLARPHAVLAANWMEYTYDFSKGEAEYRKGIGVDQRRHLARVVFRGPRQSWWPCGGIDRGSQSCAPTRSAIADHGLLPGQAYLGTINSKGDCNLQENDCRRSRLWQSAHRPGLCILGQPPISTSHSGIQDGISIGGRSEGQRVRRCIGRGLPLRGMAERFAYSD